MTLWDAGAPAMLARMSWIGGSLVAVPALVLLGMLAVPLADDD